MTDSPGENLTLETPHDWVRQGEERAERQWAATHPANAIEPWTANSNVAPWLMSAVMFALIVTLALVLLPTGKKAAHQGATITNPAPGPTTSLTTPTARATLKSCSDTMITGTVKNTSAVSETLVIAAFVDRGSEVVAIAAPNFLRISPGETVTWISPVTFAPKGALTITCSLRIYSVLPDGH
jgi:hypothetical protein